MTFIQHGYHSQYVQNYSYRYHRFFVDTLCIGTSPNANRCIKTSMLHLADFFVFSSGSGIHFKLPPD